jgi:hypothetical protein
MRTRARVTTTLPALAPDAFPGFDEDAPLDLPPLSAGMERQIRELVVSRDFDAWSEALARVGNCARPIRLRGRSERIDATTGEVVSWYSSELEPLGVTHVRCGNRRASVCPSCSRLYAADMFQLIRAGVAGGKTVPATVGENPLVFATVTAPSFGHVHDHRDGRRCRPQARGPARCDHGRPRACHHSHGEGDPALGQPLCRDCYDYPSHVAWQWWAPELWKRFTIGLRRLEVVQTAIDLGREVTYGTPKTHQHRSVPIPRSLVDELARHMAAKHPDELVFTSSRGVPLRNRMLGHASAAMTLDVYAGLFGDDLDAVADRIDEAAANARADDLRTQAGIADVLPLDFGDADAL